MTGLVLTVYCTDCKDVYVYKNTGVFYFSTGANLRKGDKRMTTSLLLTLIPLLISALHSIVIGPFVQYEDSVCEKLWQ